MSMIFVLVLSLNFCFASGNYQKKSYAPEPSSSSSSSSFSSTSAPKSNRSDTTSDVLGPQPREALAVERDILGWERRGVSIHSVAAAAEKIVVKGAFAQKSDFDRFLSKLKGDDSQIKREVIVKESSTSFGGSTTYNFEAEVENAW